MPQVSRSSGALTSSHGNATDVELKQSPRRTLSGELFSSSSSLHRRSISGSLWPSSKKSSTLADQLTNDRLTDLEAEAARSQSISRQRSCSEFSRFKEEDERNAERKISRSSVGRSMRYISKEKETDENRKIGRSPIGGSMRYIARIRSPESSKLGIDDANVVGGQILRRNSDFGVDLPSFESDRSDTSKRIPRTPAKTAISSAPTQWAMSPGRRRRPESPEGTGVSLRPVKEKKMGSLRSLGLDHLFRRKTSSSLSSSGLGEVGHRFKMMQNRALQWRFVNARSDATMQAKLADVQATMLSAWARSTELRSRVVRKRMQLEKEKRRHMLYIVLSSQMKALEEWGDLERQHSSALAATTVCLHTAVCRLPLTDGAKADLQQLPLTIMQAMNLAVATINTAASTLIPMAQKTAPLLLELAQVTRKEQSLLDECLEFLDFAAGLQVQEESLRCHLVQLHSININN